MRVLMFCPQFAPVIGGAERQAEKLGATLAARGMEVIVCTPLLVPGSPARETLEGGVQVRRFPMSDLSRSVAGWRGIGLVNGPWIALQIMSRIWRELAAADVVHCHIGSLQSVAAACAARLRRVPVICKAAMADDRSDLGEAARAGVVGRLVALLGRHVFCNWIATTEAVSQALQRAGVAPERIDVIPNGVHVDDAGADKARAVRPVRRFLYLGRLSANADRDVPGLLQAFDGVAAEIPDAELAVVGDGELLAATREQANACRHAAQIRVPGLGNPSEWLAWADCLVLPSRREGLSNALLEAMAAGIPCIAYDIPPNREVLADGAAGCLVPGDAASLQAAMLELARDGEKARTYAVAGHARVRSHYSMEAVSARYAALYQDLQQCR